MLDSSDLPASAHGADGVFATTHWSVVVAAGESESAESAAALETLCRTYWQPVYSFLRRKERTPHDAQDLTQEFFARLLRLRSLRDVARHKGRFRSFLLASLQHFLADEWDHASAQKRGGGVPPISLDALEPEQRDALDPADDLSPEKLFDRRWAATLLERAMERLAAESTAGGKERQFALLQPFLTADPGNGAYAAPATELGTTPGALAVAVHRMRARWGELVRAEVAETVGSAGDVEDELRNLFG